MDKKVVVFGGCGFLGSYVVEELLNRGYEVTAADVNPPKHFQSDIFKKCDILERKSLEKIFTEKYDFVYNFAGFANLDESVHHPVETFELNTMGTLNLLETCENNNIERFPTPSRWEIGRRNS